MVVRYKEIEDLVPSHVSDVEVLFRMKSTLIDWSYVSALKEISCYNDDVLAEILGVSVKTFRSYKKEEAELKDIIQEQVLLLISLFKYGIEVFGSIDLLQKWLSTGNFHLDGERPLDYLNTISGIRFIGSRLTAMEYGDNV